MEDQAVDKKKQNPLFTVLLILIFVMTLRFSVLMRVNHYDPVLGTYHVPLGNDQYLRRVSTDDVVINDKVEKLGIPNVESFARQSPWVIGIESMQPGDDKTQNEPNYFVFNTETKETLRDMSKADWDAKVAQIGFARPVLKVPPKSFLDVYFHL